MHKSQKFSILAVRVLCILLTCMLVLVRAYAQWKVALIKDDVNFYLLCFSQMEFTRRSELR